MTKVAIIMGSDSDLRVMQAAADQARQCEAGENRSPIYENGASPALPQFASMLGSGEAKLLPEDLEKGGGIGSGDLTLFTVHQQGEQSRGQSVARITKAVPSARRLAVLT